MLLRCVLLWLVSTTTATTSLAAVFTVTTTANSGAGSLRQAILDANATPGADAIHFNIGGGGPQVIAPAPELPAITDAVTIDGTTQPGFSGTPIVTLDGPGIGFGNGLTISAGPTTVRGLVIGDFGQAGILVHSAGTTIVGNYVGVDASGAVALPNFEGIRLEPAADGAVIGGPAEGDRNVISGNRSMGILFRGQAGVGAPDGRVVQGNFIGVDATGTVAVANGTPGISIQGSDDSRIGGTLPGEGNVISGNGHEGVSISGSFGGGSDHPVGNVLQGNRVGTDVTGTALVPNGSFGVSLFGARNTVVGGAEADARNIISGNAWSGVAVGGWCSSDACGPAEDNVVAGNFIGTDISGTLDFGNGHNGSSYVTHGEQLSAARPPGRGTSSPAMDTAAFSSVVSSHPSTKH
ncbi:MAG TPA: hypothetical protein VGF28_06595 [Thermoanaerobaculia bacterium]|jgi:hypothetical protein